MSNYDWIKVGVKAIIVNSDYGVCNGMVITVTSDPAPHPIAEYSKEIAVRVAEKEELESVLNSALDDDFAIECRRLKPYIEDDSQDLVTWESISDIIKFDIREGCEV